jgi:hypothetical protein
LHRTATGDRQQLPYVVRLQIAGQLDVLDDLPLRIEPHCDLDMVERPAVPVRERPDGHGGTRPERGQEQLFGGGAGIGADGLWFVRSQRVRADCNGAGEMPAFFY